MGRKPERQNVKSSILPPARFTEANIRRNDETLFSTKFSSKSDQLLTLLTTLITSFTQKISLRDYQLLYHADSTIAHIYLL